MTATLLRRFDILARRVGVRPDHVAVHELSPGHRGLVATDAVREGTRLLAIPPHAALAAPRNANRDSVFDDLAALTQVVRNRIDDATHLGAPPPASGDPRMGGPLLTTPAMGERDKFLLAWLHLMPLPAPIFGRPRGTDPGPFTVASLRSSGAAMVAAVGAQLGPEVPPQEAQEVATSVYDTFEAELRSRTTDVRLARMVLSRMDALPHPSSWEALADARAKAQEPSADNEEPSASKAAGASEETEACLLLPYYDMINGTTDVEGTPQNVSMGVERLDVLGRPIACVTLHAARDLKAGEELLLEYDRGEAFVGHPAPMGPAAVRLWPAYRFAMPELANAELWPGGVPHP